MAVDLVLVKTAAREARDRVREKLEPHWQKIQQLSPVQRRVAAVIAVLLVLNVLLVAKVSSGPAVSSSLWRDRRDADAFNVSSDESYGVTYIRWGRKKCPAETKIVYRGIVGGSYFKHTGGGANYVCLPSSPIYEDTGSSSYKSYMYGTEYENLDSIFGQTIHNGNVPCAVCQSMQRMNLLMIPARNVCYPGWHLEYNGFLVAEYYSHANQKVFECLDHNPELSKAGYRDENGALMYHVVGQCGSLPCPEYKDGSILTCAVCTK